MRPRSPRLSQQPVPASSLAGATVSPPRLPQGRGPHGPDKDRVPATGDHRHGALVDVGADFFSAAELAALELPGLPPRREHISRLASKLSWQHRQRSGNGGGREFALLALPDQARAEILRRRLVEAASKATGTKGRIRSALPVIANLRDAQAQTLSARTVLLSLFDRFRGERSDRATLAPFVEAFERGLLDLPDWAKARVRRLSVRTLKRWLANRRAGRDHALAGKVQAGRLSVLDRSPEAADWLIGALIDQPHHSNEQFAAFLAIEFAQGVPDEDGLLMPRPGARAVGRFLARWKNDPLNRQTLTMLADPDRWKSHFRFAGGDMSAGIVRLNQRWQIDASPADALCLDGRHSIYILIDLYSRRMMGLVTRTPRTTASLLLIKRACEAWGVPETIVTDNGSDFTSQHFVDALMRLGVHHHTAPPYSPEKKAFIERGIGTVQRGLMRMLPGFAGHNVAERSRIEKRKAFSQRLGESDADLFSVALTGAELQARLEAWLFNVYGRKPHRGLRGETPELRALQAMESQQVRFADPAAIGMLLMPPPSDGPVRVVTKKGVAVGGLDYYCDGLLVGQRVQVRLDPADYGQVYLYTDTNPWIFLGIGLNPDVAGIDRAEMTGRVRAAQDTMVKAHRAELRALKRATDLPAVVTRLIGNAPAPQSPPEGHDTHDTPDLVEAAIAAVAEGARPRKEAAPVTEEEAARHQAFVTDFQSAREARQIEETAEEKYARWKKLAEVVASGGEISADSRQWFEIYAKGPQWRAQRAMEEEFGA